MTDVATIDFETRSACDLKKHGAWNYSKHPTTEAMVLRYKLPGQVNVGMWHMAHPQHLIAESPPPIDLFEHISNGGLVEAHNALFERFIWRNVMLPKHGWPDIPHEQWRCSASKASACSLPRDLENAAKSMGLNVEKDMVGRRLMLKMCKPRKPRKQEIDRWLEEHPEDESLSQMPLLWHEDEEDIYRLWEYCETDVLTEEALSNALPELSPEELAIWQMDQFMNENGAKFDLDMARAALVMANEWKKRLNRELLSITGIPSGTRREAVKQWLEENEGLSLPNTTADTLEWHINNEPISGRARRVCEIVMSVNKTSARKYKSMLDMCDPDDWRARGLLVYHGAGTGRWAGKGIQIHNFPARELVVKDFSEAAEDIKSGNLDWCIAMYGDVMKLLSHALRGAIVPEDGNEFMIADYAAIEARCVLWLADAQAALDVFRRGDDIYCDMATGIYGFEVKKSIAKDWRHPDYTLHSTCRQFGKQAILGLGYGMGFVTFFLTCRKYKIFFSREDVIKIMGPSRLANYEYWVRDHLCMDGAPVKAGSNEDYANQKRQAQRVISRLLEARENPKEILHELALMKYTVDRYRSRYQEVKELWAAQEQAALSAIRNWEMTVGRSGEPKHEVDGPVIPCGKVEWFVKDDFLCCRLPSGRLMRYRSPEAKEIKTSWGEMKLGIRYMSVNGVTRKWERTHTYGGKIVENITQAVARDIMAHAMLSAHEGGVYQTIMSVHDELVSEVKIGKGRTEEFESIMSSIPIWAYGCPITAEAEPSPRYKK